MRKAVCISFEKLYTPLRAERPTPSFAFYAHAWTWLLKSKAPSREVRNLQPGKYFSYDRGVKRENLGTFMNPTLRVTEEMIKGLQKTYEAAVTRVRDGRENEEHVDVATILHTWLDMAISPLLGEKKMDVSKIIRWIDLAIQHTNEFHPHQPFFKAKKHENLDAE